MGESQPPASFHYQCAMLDARLMGIHTVRFTAGSDAEAIGHAGQLLGGLKGTLPVVGFELRQDSRSVLYRLE